MERPSPGPAPALVSQLAQQPGFVLLRDGGNWRLYQDPAEVLIANDPSSLKQVLNQVEAHVRSGGEAAGVLRYEAGYALEPRLHELLTSGAGPLCWFGLYPAATTCNLTFREQDAANLLASYKTLLGQDDYCARVETIRRLIEAGEVYQVNFTTRAGFHTTQNAWNVFAALCRRHPVPYAAFLNTGGEQILSLSPEMFFQIDRGRITVKPMKGTAGRGRFLEEDLFTADQLRRSAKNRAENVMIVDLMRNDLGRICRTGSVKTPILFDVERYPSVWQMTSTVEGELREDCTIESTLCALFPSGSVTGAPKIRSMEHIARLEDSPRGAYTGAIGFFAPGSARFNVAIRTLELHGENGRMGIGGGITYDSNPSSEWEECQWKAAFLVESQPEFRIIETLYWERKYRLLEAHLARMRESAEFFGFAFSEEVLRCELARLAARFPQRPKRVRITLSRDGEFEISHSDFLREQFGRVGIAHRPVSSRDRFLFHKTTNRGVYERTLTAARKQELDDFLFFNERGELTEGTIHNVFLLKDEVWRTPAVRCGLLPGTFRGQILKQRQNSFEAVLHFDDLKRADAVYLCNSVRGIFPVKVDWSAQA
jgi:para-aminobenzoate synthetase/4-amino-4-deoxychorismate lyase